jgi:glutamate synthase domain-containing protein 1
LVVAENGNKLYISSEEAAIRVMDPDVQNIRMPRAGEPVIGRVIV